MMKTQTILAALVAMLLLAPLACAQPSFPNAEIKWTVPADLIPHAKELLGLKEDAAKKEEVWFFDTASQDLKKHHHVVLRARRDGKDTDSTVKLRVDKSEDVHIPSSPDGKVEWDVGETGRSISQSEDAEKLKKDLLDEVIAGRTAKDLFSSQGQQKLLTSAVDSMDWAKVKRYGPVKAEVWKNKEGKPKKVNMLGYDIITAELWHLEKEGSHLDILELSIKTSGSREVVDAQAKAFFAAARKFLVEEGSATATGDTSKTSAVLEFFTPGK
jgi:hypothetical protein